MSDPNTITVNFTGICTHILSGLGAAPRHRIVLVRADHGANILDRAIPPHIPRLSIDTDSLIGDYKDIDGLVYIEPGVWQLAGAGLELGDVTPQRFSPAPEYDRDVPHLSSPSGKLESVSPEVVVQERAAAYFDVYGGAMKPNKTLHGAVFTELTVQVGAYAHPTLQVTCFWNRKVTQIHLKHGATVNIEHTGKFLGDSAYDFLLHYLIFPSVPKDAVIPEEKKKHMVGGPGDISAGCSNSQYP